MPNKRQLRARKRAAEGGNAPDQGAENAPTQPDPRPRAADHDSTRAAKLLAGVGLLVLVGLSVRAGYMWAHLQSGWLRPAVATTDERQVLVVGTQGSGTAQMQLSLRALGLEIGHETSDTACSFARDGTISWMHGLRFLPGHATDTSVELLCLRSHGHMGFHPAMFGPAKRGCSQLREWNSCWRAECVDRVRAEWGCASRQPPTCHTPFRRTLLQARHPVRTVESLVVKFCANIDARPSPQFVLFMVALFPQHAWDRDGSCVESIAWYVLLYVEAMVAAQARGLVNTTFQVEHTNGCAVAALAGLDAPNTTVHGPSFTAVAHACTRRATAHAGPTGPAVNQRNQRNRGRVNLTFADLARRGSPELETRMRQLAFVLHYNHTAP